MLFDSRAKGLSDWFKTAPDHLVTTEIFEMAVIVVIVCADDDCACFHLS
jgi:hypothetical protein